MRFWYLIKMTMAVLSHSDDTSGQALDSFGQFDEEEKINDFKVKA